MANSRAEEARRVLAVVAHYVNAGNSLSNVAVVVPDIEAYEAPLTDAAATHELPTATWTQLPLTDTLPYRLIAALCRVLDDNPCTAEEFLLPLEYQWSAPSNDANPVDATTCASLRKKICGGSDPAAADRPMEWCDRLRAGDTSVTVEAYRQWLQTHHYDGTPSKEQLVETLEPVLEEYEETVLPLRKQRDNASLTQTAQTARAVVRTQKLVEEVADKYSDRIADGQSRSWTLVSQLAETIGGLRAGRREHANANALDIVDANDTWAASRAVVIAVGLRQGGWIEQPHGSLPSELRDRLLGSSPSVSSLGVRARWSEDRVRDHFQDTVATATERLVCTRPRLDEDGNEIPPSPLLAIVETDRREPAEVFASD